MQKKALPGLTRVNIFLVVLAFLGWSCHNEPKVASEVVVNENHSSVSFNADSAFQFVKAQVDFGPRVPGSKSHEDCANYLVNKLKSYTPNVIVQKTVLKTYDNKSFQIKNIIASFNPDATQRILLCSHWDTRPWSDQDTINKDKPSDGANDGASGVGVLLELARIFKDNNPTIGIDILFLDLEDYGKPSDDNSYGLGTQYWARNKHKPGYSASFGILLDMVGAPQAVFPMEGVSMQYASSTVQKVWDIANRLGYSNHFSYEKTGGIVDDHNFINEIGNIPCIDIVDHDLSTGSFGAYWHTHQDNINMVDKNTLKAVGETLLEVVRSEK